MRHFHQRYASVTALTAGSLRQAHLACICVSYWAYRSLSLLCISLTFVTGRYVSGKYIPLKTEKKYENDIFNSFFADCTLRWLYLCCHPNYTSGPSFKLMPLTVKEFRPAKTNLPVRIRPLKYCHQTYNSMQKKYFFYRLNPRTSLTSYNFKNQFRCIKNWNACVPNCSYLRSHHNFNVPKNLSS